MSQTKPPDVPALTLERFTRLLDAYGAAPERWPAVEREGAERLIERSAMARARWDEARELDHLLDTVPDEPPSALLADRVLAAAPRRRRPVRWRTAIAVAVPLAAAAVVTLWIGLQQAPTPEHTDTASVAIGTYASPTDVLLAPYGLDVYATVPSVGCADSVLGCPNVDAEDGGSVSQRRLGGVYA